MSAWERWHETESEGDVSALGHRQESESEGCVSAWEGLHETESEGCASALDGDVRSPLIAKPLMKPSTHVCFSVADTGMIQEM